MKRTTNERIATVVTEYTVIEVEQLGRGCTGRIVDSTSPLYGLEAWGDRWFVIAELDARAKNAPVACTRCESFHDADLPCVAMSAEAEDRRAEGRA